MAGIGAELTPTDKKPWMYVNPATEMRSIGDEEWARTLHMPGRKIVLETDHLVAYYFIRTGPLILIHKDLIDGDT